MLRRRGAPSPSRLIHPKFKAFNVLEDDALRQGIKEFSSWPTIPQLDVGGEFVGGCDIVREMYQSSDS
jgi:monothiol glutaredoxin